MAPSPTGHLQEGKLPLYDPSGLHQLRTGKETGHIHTPVQAYSNYGPPASGRRIIKPTTGHTQKRGCLTGNMLQTQDTEPTHVHNGSALTDTDSFDVLYLPSIHQVLFYSKTNSLSLYSSHI
jgi:hypothetical protein